MVQTRCSSLATEVSGRVTISPLYFFSLFLNDLENHLHADNITGIPVECNTDNLYFFFKVYILLYADDTIIIAVGQLYEDKSLALRARDLIFFTTDLQTVNYYSTIHCWS